MFSGVVSGLILSVWKDLDISSPPLSRLHVQVPLQHLKRALGERGGAGGPEVGRHQVDLSSLQAVEHSLSRSHFWNDLLEMAAPLLHSFPGHAYHSFGCMMIFKESVALALTSRASSIRSSGK